MKLPIKTIESFNGSSLEKDINDLIQQMFVENRGLWVLPGSLSVFMCDGLEGIFELLAGNPKERNTKETISAIKKLGYEVTIKSPPHDDSNMDLKKILIEDHGQDEAGFLDRILHAEDRIIDLFMESNDDEKWHIIKNMQQNFDKIGEGTKAEVERARRFLVMLKIIERELRQNSISSFAFGGKL